VDNGEEFTYTGSGGRELSGNKRVDEQSSDQTLTSSNTAIAKNCYAKFDDKKGGNAGADWKKGKEIRVVRGKSKKKKMVNQYEPKEGNRYDGI
jgi:E3 ubiquitin-protein ligase UHRF1